MLTYPIPFPKQTKQTFLRSKKYYILLSEENPIFILANCSLGQTLYVFWVQETRPKLRLS